MSPSLAAAESLARAKSPEAFRTISEVSLELDVPQHVLRFWETRFSQIKPVKRAGRRRFYRPEDVALLRGIRSLLYSDGYTIKGVQKVLREKGWRVVADIGRAAQVDVRPWPEAAAEARRDLEDEDNLDGAVDIDDEIQADDDEEAARREGPLEILMRAHADAAETLAQEEGRRVRLELLLAELLTLRDRLQAVRNKA